MAGRSVTLEVLGTLTNVGGTFSHHVLVVVDTGVRDSGLGFIRRDHKEFLQRMGQGQGDGTEREVQVRNQKPQDQMAGVQPGLQAWGVPGARAGAPVNAGCREDLFSTATPSPWSDSCLSLRWHL